MVAFLQAGVSAEACPPFLAIEGVPAAAQALTALQVATGEWDGVAAAAALERLCVATVTALCSPDSAHCLGFACPWAKQLEQCALAVETTVQEACDSARLHSSPQGTLLEDAAAAWHSVQCLHTVLHADEDLCPWAALHYIGGQVRRASSSARPTVPKSLPKALVRAATVCGVGVSE